MSAGNKSKYHVKNGAEPFNMETQAMFLYQPNP